ncbi:MAG: hypothetical protein ACPLXP_00025 [Microgenomates group bacterium]
MIGAIIGLVCYLIVESAIFGTFALVLSRKAKDQYDALKAIIIVVVLLLVQSLLITPLLNLVDLRIGNTEVANFLGTDKGSELMGFSLSNLVFNLIQGVIGYVFGKKILAKVNI